MPHIAEHHSEQKPEGERQQGRRFDFSVSRNAVGGEDLLKGTQGRRVGKSHGRLVAGGGNASNEETAGAAFGQDSLKILAAAQRHPAADGHGAPGIAEMALLLEQVHLHLDAVNAIAQRFGLASAKVVHLSLEVGGPGAQTPQDLSQSRPDLLGIAPNLPGQRDRNEGGGVKKARQIPFVAPQAEKGDQLLSADASQGVHVAAVGKS